MDGPIIDEVAVNTPSAIVESPSLANESDHLLKARESIHNWIQRLADSSHLSPDYVKLLQQPGIFDRLVNMSREQLHINPAVRVNTPCSEEAFKSAEDIILNHELLAQGWNETPAELQVQPVKDSQTLAEISGVMEIVADSGKAGLSLAKNDIVAELYFGDEIDRPLLGCSMTEAMKKSGRTLSDENKQCLREKLHIDPDSISMGRAFTMMHVRVIDASLLYRDYNQLGDFGFEVEFSQCHHLTAGVIPEDIDMHRDFTPTSLHLIAFLEVFDKYQAYLHRSLNEPEAAYHKTLTRLEQDYSIFISEDSHNGALRKVLDENHYLARCRYWLDFLQAHRAEFIG